MGCCDHTRHAVASTGRTIASGMGGLTIAALHLETPSRAVLAGRALRCFGIPGQVPPCERLAMGMVCRECGCLAMAKIRVASQECPLGKWGAVPPERAVAGGLTRRHAVPVRPPDM